MFKEILLHFWFSKKIVFLSPFIFLFFTKVGKISDVAANVSIGYQPEVEDILANTCKPHAFLFEGLGERHDLQGPGRLQQATPVRTQRNAEGGKGGKGLNSRKVRWEKGKGGKSELMKEKTNQ